MYTWGWTGNNFGIGCLGHPAGISRETPTRVEFPDQSIKIKQISSGKYHMAALGHEGEVWIWGRGEYGRIGNGGNGDQPTAVPVEFFLECDINIKKLSCGSNFTLALTDTGQIYGWGSNDHSQLGLGAGFAVDMFAMENYPKIIDFFEDNNEEIVDLSAGQHHAVAINKSGELYLWGMKMWMEPHMMTALSAEKIVGAGCGTNYTIAINDAGELFR